jgi:Lrp/AsnC family leucine-responsive transcriptional regulator
MPGWPALHKEVAEPRAQRFYFGDGMLDSIGWNIVKALQENARLSYAELGRQVGLTAPAVAERVRKLEETGIITGYHATVDPTKLGFALPV